jgi:CheY-like chemotaxis protein
LIADVEGQPWVLPVDEIVGPRELLIQPLDSLLAGHPVLSGASFSGDGELILVLRLPGLVCLHRRSADGRQAGPSPPAGERARPILVVDDSISVRRVATRHLEALGYPVEEAADGLEALRKLRGSSYGLVLTDLEMPRMDGIELLGELNRPGPAARIPVLVATSRHDPETRRRVLDLGARAILAKPVDRDELARHLGAILAAGNTDPTADARPAHEEPHE